MDNYKQELMKILYLEVFNYVTIIVVIIAAIIACYILKKQKTYKILLFVSSVFLCAMIAMSIDTFIPLCKDIKNDTFVKLENVYVSCQGDNFDSSGFQRVLICEENNKSIVLKTTKRFEKKCFNGIVVYSKESKYLVFVKELT